jgi:hypothetical protein
VFQSFINERSGALAIIGKSGSGKPVLAKSIMNHISSVCKGVSVGGWFYSRRKGQKFVSYLPLLKSVLCELLQENKSLFQFCKNVYSRKSPAPSRDWSTAEPEEILKDISTSGASLILIFDGLDEAKDDQIIRLTKTLLEYAGSNTKVILVSRPLKQFDKKIWSSRRVILQLESENDVKEIIEAGIEILKKATAADLSSDDESLASFTQSQATPKSQSIGTGKQALFQTKSYKDIGFPSINTQAGGLVGSIAMFSPRPDTESTLIDLRSYISERADGVVLWVVRAFESLKAFVQRGHTNCRQLISHAEQLPEGLDPFYQQITEGISQRLSGGLRKARRILMWISAANEVKRFTIGELWDAMALHGDHPSNIADGGQSKVVYLPNAHL